MHRFQKIHLGTVGSTQTMLEHWLENEPLEAGTMVIAEHQTEGRGMQGNQWEDEIGENLLLSVLFYPENLDPRNGFLLNQAAAVAVFRAVSVLLPGKNIQIKWPNDILCGQKKIAGILVRNQIFGSQMRSTIWGIGLNVNQASFPDFGNKTATSIRLERGSRIEKDIAEEIICREIGEVWKSFCGGEMEKLREEYLSALFGLGEERTFVWDEKEQTGTITGLDEYGRLQVKTGQGIRAFDLKEITFIY